MVFKNPLNDAFTNDIIYLFSKEFIDRVPDSEITAESLGDRKRRRALEDIEKLKMAVSESETICTCH